MNGPAPRVSVIVPCYNERDNVESCVDQIGEALVTARIPFEILVVNDGSTDDTLERAHSLSTSRSFVRVVDLGRNCGKAVALREGIRRASGDVVAFFDADLQYSPADLVTMIRKLDHSIDFVNGNRDYNGYGASRTAFSKLYNRIVRLFFRTPIRDSNCGVKVLTKRAADPSFLFDYGLPLIVPLLRVRGFRSLELDVMLRERRNGESKYFEKGRFLGGPKNIRDIAYHSIMLLNLLAHVPLESSKGKRVWGKT